MTDGGLAIADLQGRYRRREASPVDVMREILARCDVADPAVWISRVPAVELLAAAQRLQDRDPADLPLWGIPFAVKDNIDAAALPTTAGCPAFAYRPEQDAFAVRRLLDAGALLVGKTNLDQFATGLVGTRTPYGIPKNAVVPEFVPGGSSSGSAVAVALGLASFALGTDTAGSGRIPASLNDLVGLKPSLGLVSNAGVVPACRSLDCVSVFAASTADAGTVLDVIAGFDPADPFAREYPAASAGVPTAALAGRRIAVPAADQLQFFGNFDAARVFAEFCDRLVASGVLLVPIDFRPFAETAALLYQGPWLAERFLAVGNFIAGHPDEVHPVTREIILAGSKPSAADAFRAMYRLAELRRQVGAVWQGVDALLTPTAGTAYRSAEVEAEPVSLNTNLGYYTNFVNLLDLAALAVPAGYLANGLPFGVTFSAPAGSDRKLLALGEAVEIAGGRAAGPKDAGSRKSAGEARAAAADGTQPIVVCGAHMSGLPLNPELIALGATLRGTATTAPDYRLYIVPDKMPPRPGLIRVGEGEGRAIEVEVWNLPSERVGNLLSAIASPLGLGSVRLADGSSVHGFLCEACIAPQARDITEFGGWRAYLSSQRPGADTPDP